MSMSGDYNPPGGDFDSGPNYPSAFGITFTPMVSGIGLGLLGLAAAAFAWTQLVEPLRVETEDLRAKVTEKQKQLDDQKNIEKQLREAKVKLTQVEQQRQQVYSLFAQKKNMDTVLLDLNQLIDKNNVGLRSAKEAKLATCPSWIKEQFTSIATGQQYEEQIGPLIAEAKLRKFTPEVSPAAATPATATTVPGVLTDGSLGAELNNKLKRQTFNVEIEGNFNQAQSIIRRIELLQPLLILRNVDVKYGGEQISKTEPTVLYEFDPKNPEIPLVLKTCQPDTVVTTSFKMDALLPLTAEEQKLIVPTPTVSPGATPGASPSPSPAAK
jgi:type IV pilus assembly protein PilO